VAHTSQDFGAQRPVVCPAGELEGLDEVALAIC
jgi:hypothetical protein